MGSHATATADNAVAIGANSVADEENTVSVGSVGNERRVTNVAPAVKSTDATNLGQVNSLISNSEARINSRITKVERKLKGGVAGAIATASIPQVTMAGASMFGLGVGSYSGQSAIAVGYSHATDSNKVIIKLNAGATTQGNFSVGAGFGYQW